MRIKQGSIYTAHCFVNRERVNGSGHYHFLIVMVDKFFDADAGKISPIYLGVKLDIDHSPYGSESQSFWFDSDGIHSSEYVAFKLKRKINKRLDT